MFASRRQRAVSALASASLTTLTVSMLVIGLAPAPRLPQPVPGLVAFAVPPERTAPPRVRPIQLPPVRAGRANWRARTQPAPAPAAAMPIASAAPLLVDALPGLGLPPEPGAGGGGGSGSGGGPGGPGAGAGDSGQPQPVIRARQTHGHLSPRDVPDGVIAPGTSAAVRVRFVVGVAGRITSCTVTGPSGLAPIDAVPCPLIVARYRFRPARNRAGQAVPATISETHTWTEPASATGPGSAALIPRGDP